MLWVMDGLCQMIMQTEGTGKKIPMWIYINTCLFFDFERDHIVSFSEIFDMCRLCFKLG